MSALITLLFGIAALLGAAFGFMELRMLVRFLRNRAAIRAPRNGNGAGNGRGDGFPTVTIQIPLYNERTAAESIVRAAAAQDYPRDRFDIQVLDDSTDETSSIVARVSDEVRGHGVAIQHLRREVRTGYKAGALAEGLTQSGSEFVAVFDADFVPQTGFLREMLNEQQAFHEPDIAFAQARWAWATEQRTGWLSKVLSLLLDRHFRVQKPVREFLGHVATFNGSGGVWRRAAIDDAGGWAADTLTEDLDLSYRCALAGWRGRYLHDVKVLNELPGHMRAFKLQQRRWSKGTAQCLRKLVAGVVGSRGRVEDRVEEVFLLAAYAIHPLLLGCLVLWPWAVLYIDRTAFWVMQAFMALGIVAAAVSLLVTIHERDGRWSLAGAGEVAAGVAVGVGLLVNNTVGQIQGLIATGGEFLRTPKFSRPSGNGSAAPDEVVEQYKTPLHWTFWVEILVIGYCIWGAAFLVGAGEGFWAVAMLFWAACLGLVVQQQIVDRPA